jgi:rod shape-determining protein MreD
MSGWVWRSALALIVLAGFVLNAALGPSLVIRGVAPHLGLSALLLACLFTSARTGAALGFLLGLLEASFTPLYVGSLLTCRLVVGFAVGALEERVFRDNLLVAIAIVFLGTLMGEGLFFLFVPQPAVGRWAVSTLGEAGYNAILAPPLYWLIRGVGRAGAAPARAEA